MLFLFHYVILKCFLYSFMEVFGCKRKEGKLRRIAILDIYLLVPSLHCPEFLKRHFSKVTFVVMKKSLGRMGDLVVLRFSNIILLWRKEGRKTAG